MVEKQPADNWMEDDRRIPVVEEDRPLQFVLWSSERYRPEPKRDEVIYPLTTCLDALSRYRADDDSWPMGLMHLRRAIHKGNQNEPTQRIERVRSDGRSTRDPQSRLSR